LAAAPASAQSFQGSSTVVSGSASVTTGANTTTVNVGSSQAVINWTPFDTATSPGTPIDFQPAGTTATFQSTSDFAVLNRILPADASRPVFFNGTVISQIQSTVTTPGGTVFFYSPGGILVGSSAVFDVGNLGLTTLDPFVDGNGNWYNGNQVQFQQGNPASIVNIQPGAQLTASRSNSYIALVAPSVQNNGGTIDVNGSAALVGAEAATITFSPDGLFDIQVTVGTSAESDFSSPAVVNSGTITGPAGTAGSDNHRVYMVAVPKNDLLASIFMSAGSSVGFDVASAADVSGNAIILSAGHDIAGGEIVAARSSGAGTGKAIITSLNAAYTSDVKASATGSAVFEGNGNSGPGGTSFAANLTVHSDENVSLQAFDGGTVNVAGNVALDADVIAASPTQSVTGGLAFLFARDASTISVGGDATIRANGVGGNATGGESFAYLDGASDVTVGGALRVRSEGLSGAGGTANGGTSSLFITGGATLTVGELNVSADAVSGDTVSSLTPGLATGGNASITVDGAGSLLTVVAGNSSGNEDFGDYELLSAEAFGGSSSGGVGGAAQGGEASFNVTSGGVVNLPADPGEALYLRMFARAYGGNTFVTGGTGGAATGGDVSLNINGGSLNSGNMLLPSSFAQGGSADASVTGAANGGNAVGGTRNVTIVNGELNGSFAGGGPGAVGGNGSALATGGNGTGGTSNFFMDNGTITATTDAYGISRVSAFTQNAGGAGAVGGSASGGVTNVTIQNGSVITVNPDTNGLGGVVTFNSNNLTPDLTTAGAIASGDATAGTVNVAIVNSQINAAQFDVFANAASGWIATSGGAGANARTGNATGGNATLNLVGASISADTLNVSANGDAGSSEDTDTVNAGSGTGGNARIFASGGSSIITVNDLTVDASGTGGTAFGPGNGGNAIGGRALLQANNGGNLTVTGSANVSADADGHSAQVQGRGGDASSGFAEASAVGGGTLVINGDLAVTATAESGDGDVTGLATAQVQTLPNDVLPNALLRASDGSVTVTGFTTIGADSYGGAGLRGGTGGEAQGGLAAVNADNSLDGPSSISLQGLVVSANAEGGGGGIGLSNAAGGAGGAATGGAVNAFAGAGNGTLTVAGQAFLNANAIGGTGGDGGGGGATGGVGGAGGAAVGGNTTFGTLSRLDTGSVNTGNATFSNVLAYAVATGGDGGAGGDGSSGIGNGGAGGDATGGASILLVRGSDVTMTGSATMAADALGGDGGSGAVQGVGGDATVGGDGGVAVVVTSRFEHPEQRGFLDAADIFGTAQATGGLGSVDGASIVANSPVSIEITNSDVSADLLALYASGDPQTAAAPSFLSVTNGTADIGEISMTTPGNLLISLDNSTVNVGALYLDAGNFVLPTTPPTAPGTFNVASGLQIYSDLDFVTYANFVLPFDVSIDLPGSWLTGDLTIGGTLDIAADNAVTTGAVDASNVLFNAGQGVTATSIDSAAGIYVIAGGAVSLGDLTAGGTTPGAGKVAIGSSVSVSTGAIRSTGDLGIQTAGSIATGNLIGRDLLLLAGGSLATGSIFAGNGTQPNGAIYFGNASMGTSSANVFQPLRSSGVLLPIFQAAPVAIGGTATFGGPILGGTMRGAAQGALSAQAITAGAFIQLESGALISVNGAWQSPEIELVSNDIAISSAGSLDALSSSGSVYLASTNTAGVTVGDASGSGGYRLDNSEFGRIKGGEIVVVGIDGSQATDMTIGNLSITGSQLYGDGGSVVFATGDRLTETPGGILRIAGAVSATGFGASNEIDLLSGTVEIEAVNGSLKLTGSSNSLAGLVYIEANHIHVASDAILAKLRADPLYAGHIADLNTPLAVARVDGVLNALGLELYPGQTLYVQNTGTAALPAGFLTTLDNTEVNAPDAPPEGGIEVVINGQFRTETGVVTGKAAYDLVKSSAVDEPDAFTGFSETSQLNGCLFVGGTCSQTQARDPVAAISSEISIVSGGTLDDSPTAPAADDGDEGGDGSGEDEDDGGDTGSAPIAPPAPLINTRQLNPNVEVVEPVAGAGNPALLGSAVDEGITEGETP
jgi:hypothetical protein